MMKTHILFVVALLLLAAPAWGQTKAGTAPPPGEHAAACSTQPRRVCDFLIYA
jgi:hypothetical protein